MQFNFIENDYVVDLNTEGVRYAGSKKYLIPHIMQQVEKLKGVKKVLDGFSGTTRVAQVFKKAGYDVDSNDLAEYSKIFGHCYLINNKPKKYYDEYIEYLNSLEGVEGYFTQYYSADGKNSIGTDGKKNNWHRINTLKIDAIRNEIDNITDNYTERCVLLTALLLAADKVSNNLGHQVSYLKDWVSRSLELLVLKPPKLIINNGNYNVYKKDIMDITDEYDLTYIDPPYNTNNEITVTTRVRYASYYHLWTTLCKNDKPKVFGAANRREDVASDSNFGAVNDYELTNYDRVFDTFKCLFEGLNTRYIIMSYSNKGKVTIKDLKECISKTYKLIEIEQIEHKENVQKFLTTNRDWLGDETDYFEYLFVFEKKNLTN